MAKTLDDILRSANGRTDPATLRAIQDEAKKAGLTKRVIHIELDMFTGNMTWNASPMDNMTHLGMLEFYKAAVLGQILKRPISAPAPTPEAEPGAPAPEPEAGAAAAIVPEVVPPGAAGDAPSA